MNPNVYQGGLPILPYRRRRQRGSGFLSSIGRIAVPYLKSAGKTIAKTGLRLAEVLSGEKPMNVDTLRDAALSTGASLVRKGGKTRWKRFKR